MVSVRAGDRPWWPAGLLFAGAAAVAVVQASRARVLWDFTYIVEHAYRIARGDVPYRDFVIPHAPGTFLIQAGLIALGGPVWWGTVVSALMAGGTVVLAAYVIRAQLESAGVEPPGSVSLVLAAPLVLLNGYAVFPQPFYDSDCTFFLLLALAAVLWSRSRPARPSRALLAGALLTVPPLFKQNIGVPGVAAILAIVGVAAFLARRIDDRRHGRQVLVGTVAATVAVLLGLQLWIGLPAFFDATVRFAMARRWPSGAGLVGPFARLDTWLSLASVLAGALLTRGRSKSSGRRIIGLSLIVIPLVAAAPAVFRWGLGARTATIWGASMILMAAFSIASMIRGRWELERAIPLIATITAVGAFSSQGVADSAYGVWPWLAVGLAGPIGWLLRTGPGTPSRSAIVAISAILACFGGWHILRLERLGFADTQGAVARATLPRLRGLSAPGTYIPDFERLVEWSRQLPPDARIAALPGEDPFFLATGRRPVLPIVMLDDTATPYSASEIEGMLVAQDVTWVVVKDPLQLHHRPWRELDELVSRRLPAAYEVDTVLSRYRILRRRSAAR
jgi:hypothetical protein